MTLCPYTRCGDQDSYLWVDLTYGHEFPFHLLALKENVPTRSPGQLDKLVTRLGRHHATYIQHAAKCVLEPPCEYCGESEGQGQENVSSA